jgi:thiamine-monophosphate kinase
MRTESEIIQRIWSRLPTKRGRSKSSWLSLGVGDDAAVIRPSVLSGRDKHTASELVLSCDAFLENVHFLADTHPADTIGHKALARATSDLAAMGATPRFFMLSLALPANRSGKWLDAVLAGMARAAREFGMILIGGDTSQNVTVIMNFTVGGEVAAGRALTRAGAQAGDAIYVSGRLGAAQLGLELIQRGLDRDSRWKRLLVPHLRPRIQLELGRWLAGGSKNQPIASAAIDTSDGLSTDLAHICEVSRVKAQIFAAQIPKVQVPVSLRRQQFEPLELALHGGDDYQLLFTASLAHRIPASFRGTSITRIGEIVRGNSRRGRHLIELVDASGQKSHLVAKGWDSFRGK